MSKRTNASKASKLNPFSKGRQKRRRMTDRELLHAISGQKKLHRDDFLTTRVCGICGARNLQRLCEISAWE